MVDWTTLVESSIAASDLHSTSELNLGDLDLVLAVQ